MSKHTLGPWHWHGARTQLHLHDRTNSCFAQVSMPNLAQYHADAALIAAAPDMLATLKLFSNIGLVEGDGSPHGELLHALEETRKVIARVEAQS